MQTVYHIALVLHIVGLTLMAGITIADYIISKQFWKQLAYDKSRAMAFNEIMVQLPRLLGVGAALLIITGVTMMAVTRGVFGEQTWFRIKFALVILAIVNGLVIGRRQGVKLKKLLAGETTGAYTAPLLKIKNTLTWFHTAQMVFFLLIFTLSVFKFNNPGAGTSSVQKQNSHPATENSVKLVYESKCAACHGSDGQAGIANAANLQTSQSDSLYVISTILNGKGAMPSFKNGLSETEIQKLVSYVYGLRK
jgi:cytochrome c553